MASTSTVEEVAVSGQRGAREPVRVRVRQVDEPSSEWLRAEPVSTGRGGGGTYLLVSAAFWVPFTLGDLVEVRRAPDGQLQVVGLRRRGGRQGLVLVFPEDAAETDVVPLLEAWRASGTWAERGCGGTVVAVSIPPLPGARPSAGELQRLLAAGGVEHVWTPAMPDDAPDDPELNAAFDARLVVRSW